MGRSRARKSILGFIIAAREYIALRCIWHTVTFPPKAHGLLVTVRLLGDNAMMRSVLCNTRRRWRGVCQPHLKDDFFSYLIEAQCKAQTNATASFLCRLARNAPNSHISSWNQGKGKPAIGDKYNTVCVGSICATSKSLI